MLWHNHFKDFLVKPSEITISAITKITNRLNIETDFFFFFFFFTKYELLKLINTIKNGKALGLDIPIEIWKIN